LASGPHREATTPFALALTGLVLGGTGTLLPIMSAAKFGSEHATPLLGGASAMWSDTFSLTAAWVVFCGALAPALLLLALAIYFAPPEWGLTRGRETCATIARATARWAMPEVHVLAFLVAFAKLGDLVTLTIGPGLWFYAAMALVATIVWRRFELGEEATA
jgi:paraquat-inducible protein A